MGAIFDKIVFSHTEVYYSPHGHYYITQAYSIRSFISQSGGMLGADIVYFNAVDHSLIDTYVGDTYSKPEPDLSQDWTLVRASIGDDLIIVETLRSLVTGDPQDRAIIRDDELHIPPHK